MKIRTTDAMVLAVAHYYGFKSIGKFRKWLQAIPSGRALYYVEKDSRELKHTRPGILLKRLY